MDSQRAAAIGIEMLEKELLVNPPAGIPASAVASFFTRLRNQLTEALTTLVNTHLGVEPNSQVLDRQYRGSWHLMTKETLRQELEQANSYGKTRLDWLVTRLAVHRRDLLKDAESWLSAQHLKRTDLVPVPQLIPADDGGTLLVYELAATDIPAGIDTLSRDQFARFAELAYFNDDTAGNILLDIAAGWFGLPVIPPAEPDEKLDTKRLLSLEGFLRANDPRGKDREKVARAALSVRQRLLRAAGLPILTAEALEPQFVEQVIDPAHAPPPAEILNALESIDDLSPARDTTEANLTAVASVEDTTLAPRQKFAAEMTYSGWGGLSIDSVRSQLPARWTPDPSALIHQDYTPTVIALEMARVIRSWTLPMPRAEDGFVMALEPSTSLRETVLKRHHLRTAFRLPSAIFPGASLVTDLLFWESRGGDLPAVLAEDLFILEGNDYEREPTHILGVEVGDASDEDDTTAKPRWGYEEKGTFSAWSENLGQPRSPWGDRLIQAESANHPESVSSLAAFTEDGTLVPQIANKPAWQPQYEGSTDDIGQQADWLYAIKRELTIESLTEFRRSLAIFSIEPLHSQLTSAGWCFEDGKWLPERDYYSGLFWDRWERARLLAKDSQWLERGTGQPIANFEWRESLLQVADSSYQALPEVLGKPQLMAIGYINHDLAYFQPAYTKQVDSSTGDEENAESALDQVRPDYSLKAKRNFRDYVTADPELAASVAVTYNRLFRGYIVPNFSSQPIQIERWTGRIKRKVYQARGARRLLASKGGLLGFDDKISTAPTYQQLLALVATLQSELAGTRAELAAARAEIIERKAPLAKNSQNSSKPPSSDLPGTRPAKPKSRKRRQRGGQPGHAAHQAVVPEHVDQLHLVRAPRCENCQADLAPAEPTGSVRHYVYELPPISPLVHQCQCLDLACPDYGQVTPASLPPGVPTGQYDPSVQAMTALLHGELRQSVQQTSCVMTKGMYVPMSPAMVAKTQQKVSAALAPAVAQAMDYAQSHARPHADETGGRLDKKKAWLWVAVCGLVTVFVIRASRGADAAQELLGKCVDRLLVTDRWGSYSWGSAKLRQLCWSHVKRDFKSFLDDGDAARRLGEPLLGQVRRMFRGWHKVRDGPWNRARFQQEIMEAVVPASGLRGAQG